MISKMLAVATLVAAASAEYQGLYVNDGSCGNNVCIGTKRDGNYCVKNGIEGGRCAIKACFGSGESVPNDVSECKVAPQAATLIDDGNQVDEVTGAALPASPATSSMKSGTIVNGMSGWRDIPQSTFFDYPPSLIGRLSLTPSTFIKPNYQVIFDCPKGYSGEGKMCDAFVFLYRCPPCKLLNDGGNLAVQLLADGWKPYSCDVKFMLDKTVPTFHHSTMVYHKQIPEGQEEAVVPTALLELAWFAYSPATAHCEKYESESQCLEMLPGECQWNEKLETCERVLCPVPKVHVQGPWKTRCAKCLEEERAQYMPTLKTPAPKTTAAPSLR